MTSTGVFPILGSHWELHGPGEKFSVLHKVAALKTREDLVQELFSVSSSGFPRGVNCKVQFTKKNLIISKLAIN